MNRISNFLKKNKKYLLIGTPILLIVLYFVFGRGSGKTELFTVARATVEQSVILSGKVETSDRADLGFADSGRLARVMVRNNQKVWQGQMLSQLEIGDLLADLKIKQANYKTSDVDLESAVENAYRTLLSEDLELTPESNDYEVDAPTVSGLYNGGEGKYKIVIDRENVTMRDYRLRIFDLERKDSIIDENSPTALGTRGLYISFGDNDLINYDETVWYLDIPNKTSSSYLANYNAYNEAKKRLDSSSQTGQASDSSSAIAKAEIEKINAEIRKNTIYAPFTGIVTNIGKEVGENASVGERIISILGEEKLEVVLQVSELDVSRLSPGVNIKISLDAFPGEDFFGTLNTVNSKETEVDGVPVYEAFVELKSDPRIKTGMSASGIIVLETKSDVLAVPSYLVKKENGINTVEVLGEKGKKEQRVVTLGLLGTDNMVEIISGLSEGEKVISIGKK